MYLLDTDTCIYLLNRKNPAAEERLRQLGVDEVGLSTITLAELYYGAFHSGKKQANAKRVKIFSSSLTLLPFDGRSAEIFGETKESLVTRGEVIGVMDLLIASVALARKATLVTHNLNEFRRIRDLQTEDWFLPSSPAATPSSAS